MNMTAKEVAQMLKELRIPIAYRAFPQDEETAPAPPFCVYYYDESRDMYADSSNYKKIEFLTVEIYTTEKDFKLENRLETTFKNHGLTWRRFDTYIETEQMHEATYELTLLLK